MTPEHEQEVVDALKSIDYSFKYLMQYVMVIAGTKLQVPPVPFPDQPKRQRKLCDRVRLSLSALQRMRLPYLCLLRALLF